MEFVEGKDYTLEWLERRKKGKGQRRRVYSAAALRERINTFLIDNELSLEDLTYSKMRKLSPTLTADLGDYAEFHLRTSTVTRALEHIGLTVPTYSRKDVPRERMVEFLASRFASGKAFSVEYLNDPNNHLSRQVYLQLHRDRYRLSSSKKPLSAKEVAVHYLQEVFPGITPEHLSKSFSRLSDMLAEKEVELFFRVIKNYDASMNLFPEVKGYFGDELLEVRADYEGKCLRKAEQKKFSDLTLVYEEDGLRKHGIVEIKNYGTIKPSLARSILEKYSSINCLASGEPIDRTTLIFNTSAPVDQEFIAELRQHRIPVIDGDNFSNLYCRAVSILIDELLAESGKELNPHIFGKPPLYGDKSEKQNKLFSLHRMIRENSPQLTSPNEVGRNQYFDDLLKAMVDDEALATVNKSIYVHSQKLIAGTHLQKQSFSGTDPRLRCLDELLAEDVLALSFEQQVDIDPQSGRVIHFHRHPLLCVGVAYKDGTDAVLEQRIIRDPFEERFTLEWLSQQAKQKRKIYMIPSSDANLKQRYYLHGMSTLDNEMVSMGERWRHAAKKLALGKGGLDNAIRKLLPPEYEQTYLSTADLRSIYRGIVFGDATPIDIIPFDEQVDRLLAFNRTKLLTMVAINGLINGKYAPRINTADGEEQADVGYGTIA